MKTHRLITIFAAFVMMVGGVSAQNNSIVPNHPLNQGSNPGIVTPPGGSGLAPAGNPQPNPNPPINPNNPPMWGTSNSMMNGGPWGPGAFTGPYYNNGPAFNYGKSRVIAVGYDAQDVWQTVPMVITWQWNGFFYDVTVQNAWNPWTQVWEYDLDIPAFQTSYTLRGVPYTFYANLSTGTYYFNP